MKGALMARRFLILISVLLLFSSAVGAQDEGGQLRVFQIGSNSADVYLDGQLMLEDLNYPFATDYFPLASGAHTVGVAKANADADTAQSIDVTIEAGHTYTV